MAWRGNQIKPTVNPVPNNINHGTEKASMRMDQDRAQQVRRDKDTTKDFSVTLMDVDSTIYKYLEKNISPTIMSEGRLIKVPINYASPERWKSIRKDGYLRDKNGKVQCPTIAFRRSTMQRNDNLITLNRYLQYPTVKRFSQKNQYDKFNLMSGFKPVQEVYSVALPDHVIINYDFIVWTDLVEQGNAIIEKINFATEDYWGDKHNFKFRTSISDYNFQVEVSADQDRIVRTTFSMMVYAYLLPDKYENYKSTIQKAFTARKIVVNTEVTGKTIQEAQEKMTRLTELNGNKVPLIDEKLFTPSEVEVGKNMSDAGVFDYQSFLTTKTGSIITTNNGSGSAVFLFQNTSFNDYGETSDYQKFMLFIDDRTISPINYTYQVSGSDIVVATKTSAVSSFLTTGSIIIGYGNIS